MRIAKPALGQEVQVQEAQGLVDGAYVRIHDDAEDGGDDDRGHGDGHEEDRLEEAGTAQALLEDHREQQSEPGLDDHGDDHEDDVVHQGRPEHGAGSEQLGVVLQADEVHLTGDAVPVGEGCGHGEADAVVDEDAGENDQRGDEQVGTQLALP